MPDPTSAPGTTETVVTATTAATTPPSSEAAPVIQGNDATDAARKALYDKYYPDAGTSTSAPVATTPASAAQADTTQVTTAPAGVDPAQFQQAMAAIAQEFAALKESIGRPTQVAQPAVAEAEPGWISLLREGKVKEAEAALADTVAKMVQAQSQGPTVEMAVARARELAQAENHIESFVKDLRSANPDIVDMEPFIAMDAQQRLAALQQAGQIKSTGDAVQAYKKAVLDATESARKVAQKLRGSGKIEAMTRSREVLSAQTMNPQQVDANRQQQVTDTEPLTGEASVADYLEKRKSAAAGLHNPYARV